MTASRQSKTPAGGTGGSSHVKLAQLSAAATLFVLFVASVPHAPRAKDREAPATRPNAYRTERGSSIYGLRAQALPLGKKSCSDNGPVVRFVNSGLSDATRPVRLST